MSKRIGYLVVCALVITSFFIGCNQAPTLPAPSTTSPVSSIQKEPIKVGLLYSLTGPMAQAGKAMADTAKFALEVIGNDIAGRKIECITEDDMGKPEVAIDKAKKLVENDKVVTILGPVVGGIKLAVAGYMAKAGIPHLPTGPAPWPTTEQGWSILPGGVENQYPGTMGPYAFEKMGLKTMTLMSNEAVHGRGFVASFKTGFESKGGKVIQEQYAPFPCNDYASYIANLKDADALGAWYDGADAILFLSQINEFGVHKRMQFVGVFFGSFMAPYILNAMPKPAAEALIGKQMPALYSPLLDFPENKKFVEVFKKKFNYTPEDTEAQAYNCMEILIAALKSTGGDTTPEKLKQAILAQNFIGTLGPVKFDPKTKCRVGNVYIVKVDRINGEYIWVPVETYKDVQPQVGLSPGGPPK